MATTSPVITNKQVLIAFYLFSLIATAIITGLIIWMLNKDDNLVTEDFEIYQQIIDDIDQGNGKLSLIDMNITTLNAKLETETTVESRTPVLFELSALYTQALLINEQIGDNLRLTLTLELPSGYAQDSRSQIDRLKASTQDYESSLIKINKQLFTLQLNTNYQHTLICYDGINIKGSTEAISGQIEQCSKILDETVAFIGESKQKIPFTLAYLGSIKQYWEVNQSLLEAIDLQDKVIANELQAQLATISAKRATDEVAATTEIDNLLKE